MLEQSCWLILQDGKIAALKDRQQFPNQDAIASLSPHFIRQFHLGFHEGIPCYVAEMDVNFILPDSLFQLPLKKSFTVFDESWHGLISRATSVLNWDKNHQYCGRCGNKTCHESALFERVCKQCHQVFYPRISPSIIVLIQKEDKILMARSPHFPEGHYGLIAGFVEIGESIEEAVHREVQEEVGLTIKNLRYFGSQSWPFPDSLMLAFFADYAAGEIQIDKIEIETAEWFTLENLPSYASKASIAWKLIDAKIHGLMSASPLIYDTRID